MQNQVINEMVLFPIPLELLEEIGLDPMDVVQMSVVDDKLVIEKVTDDEFVCDGDCESCPFDDIDCDGDNPCDGDCENCPCCRDCDER